MGKHKGDILIGERMVEEVYRLFPTNISAAERLAARERFSGIGNKVEHRVVFGWQGFIILAAM